jgi:hypothetical protein
VSILHGQSGKCIGKEKFQFEKLHFPENKKPDSGFWNQVFIAALVYFSILLSPV